MLYLSSMTEKQLRLIKSFDYEFGEKGYVPTFDFFTKQRALGDTNLDVAIISKDGVLKVCVRNLSVQELIEVRSYAEQMQSIKLWAETESVKE